MLAALRRAGCEVFLDEEQLYCSPPIRAVDWPGGVSAAEEAFEEELYWDLHELVEAERLTVH